MIKFGSPSIVEETKINFVSHGISLNFKIMIWMFNIYLSGKGFCLASVIDYT